MKKASSLSELGFDADGDCTPTPHRRRLTKVAIIGAGNVGMAIAEAILSRCFSDGILLQAGQAAPRRDRDAGTAARGTRVVSDLAVNAQGVQSHNSFDAAQEGIRRAMVNSACPRPALPPPQHPAPEILKKLEAAFQIINRGGQKTCFVPDQEALAVAVLGLGEGDYPAAKHKQGVAFGVSDNNKYGEEEVFLSVKKITGGPASAGVGQNNGPLFTEQLRQGLPVLGLSVASVAVTGLVAITAAATPATGLGLFVMLIVGLSTFTIRVLRA